MFNTYRKLKIWNLVFLVFTFFSSCIGGKTKLTPVSYSQFEVFVNQTGYVTDAEKYGWSIVQIDVDNYKTVQNANWRTPDGVHKSNSKQLPVTQVSYNDALAYCKWAKKRLPTYEEYWDLIKNDTRVIVSDNKFSISKINEVNVLGNVWDITEVEDGNPVRLAGRSLFCPENSCKGTVKGRELFVDKETGNINVGFCVID